MQANTVNVPARPNKEVKEEEEYTIWHQIGIAFLCVYIIAFLLSGSVFWTILGVFLLQIMREPK